MDSWESTLLVLKDPTAFRTYFACSPNLTEPKLLFELNSSGFARKNVMSTIDAGAGVVSDAISDLKRNISEFRKEQADSCLHGKSNQCHDIDGEPNTPVRFIAARWTR
jgi:hypothetical protein